MIYQPMPHKTSFLLKFYQFWEKSRDITDLVTVPVTEWRGARDGYLIPDIWLVF